MTINDYDILVFSKLYYTHPRYYLKCIPHYPDILAEIV